MVSCSATPAPQTGVAPAPVPAPVQAPAPAPAPASVQAPASAVPTVGEVFDRHAAAVGGRAAWRAHDTRTTTTELRITGGMDQYGNPRDVRGTMNDWRKGGNRRKNGQDRAGQSKMGRQWRATAHCRVSSE